MSRIQVEFYKLLSVGRNNFIEKYRGNFKMKLEETKILYLPVLY